MSSEGGELGPEFSESEKERLGFIKDQAETGKIGGLEDKPSPGREFAEHHRSQQRGNDEPAWQDLPAGTSDEALAKLRGGEPESEKSREEPPIEAKGAQRQIGIVGGGSVQEIFFKTLEKNYPELGISVKPKAIDSHGNRIRVRGAAGVWIESNKSAEIQQRLAHISQKNPAIKVLVMSNRDRKEAESLGYQLENQGVLPDGTTKRLNARLIQTEIDRLNSDDPHLWPNEIAKLEQAIKSLGVEPFSNEELGSLLLEKVIIPEFGSPKEPV